MLSLNKETTYSVRKETVHSLNIKTMYFQLIESVYSEYKKKYLFLVLRDYYEF